MSIGVDDFREAADEPLEAACRLVVQVRPSGVWAGMFRVDGSDRPGGRQVWAVRLVRPAGKTTAECVAAALMAAWQAQQGEAAVQ